MPYDTRLSPADEARFENWLSHTGRALDLQDYDLRGAWNAGIRPDARGHLPDTYKKPNHPTFSRESQYSNAQHSGGQWVQAPSGRWIFMASPWNMNNTGAGSLMEYFARVEPDSIPVLPINWSLRR